jgi:XTP/dITP diphosphohydrolase
VAEFFGDIIKVTHVSLDIPEIRSDDVHEIALQKAHYAFDRLLTPLIVDDTLFSIDSLKGFPGPYAAYVLHTLGNAGILKIMKDVEDRNAHFTTAIAFADKNCTRVFSGTIHGRIVTTARGTGGFGYDSIFEINGQTLAELPIEEKSRISHRARALSAFRDWVIREYKPIADNTNG